ncbi:MAG: lactonase family protein [Planctomycetota bacterium]
MLARASLLVLLNLILSMNIHAQQIDVWLGVGSRGESSGIYHCLLNLKTGKLTPSTLVGPIDRPGFITLHPDGTHIYSTGSLNDVPSVACWKIVKRGPKAALELVNAVPIGDGGAAHVSVDPTGKILLSAQYGGGSTAAYELASSGEIVKQTTLIQHQGGSGVFGNRQDAPHAHWTGFSPDNRFAFVPDLGLDQVVIYQVDLAAASISAQGKADLPPGSGPRHMKFHQNGKWIYVLNELSLTVSAFDYDAKNGSMQIKQTVATVAPEELAREKFKSCSEIRIHPNGRFVYAANRGHDTITVFAIEDDGTLSAIQNEHVRGSIPRNFNLDPNGKWLLAGGQASNTLASFEIDPKTGLMTYNQNVINTPAPICIVFDPANVED